mmetsp:Transcript_17519/g.26604  ORF Transcript_17519/g.26604 Transcript_17519/m.26604 type:complete len:174 (+) Transcript_17519:138-659(+)|eukprot:CAMPEP_0178926286 /NCGR_PEP_ID=MMETSP0786-20121207/18440_1 /TAXON_ID=186022 /ORGANISM="Thalassionema frauenfeldii, Strain CCMP 1798" /LENGTH=173 /DNA_ID=CAMNT_0020601375 /DNA_START=51 /DNA_END=572 /DNA_ORIENTATION=+
MFEDIDPQLRKETIACVLQRSMNKSVVVYEGLLDEGGNLDPQKPVDVYWLDIDPATVAKNRKKGKMDDREELDFLGRTMAYGVKYQPHPTEEGAFVMSLVALPKKAAVLKLIENGEKKKKPVVVMEIDGEDCYLKFIWVELKTGMIGLPKVLYVKIKGISIATGEEREETIKQ